VKTRSAQKPIIRGVDTPPTSIQYEGIDHRGEDALMTEEFLDGANVVSILEKVAAKLWRRV
jgi:hypothetical protein